MRKRPMFAALAGVLLALLTACALRPIGFWACWVCGLLAAAAVVWRFPLTRRPLTWLLIASASLMLFRIGTQELQKQNALNNQAHYEQIELVVCDREKQQGPYQSYQYRFSSPSFAGKVKAFLPQDYAVGTRLWADCTLAPIENLNNPGQFDSVAYEAAQQVYCTAKVKNAAVISRGTFSLAAVREKITERAVALAGPDAGGILAAMLIGDDSALQKDIKNSFSQVGLSHILVISGMHLGLLYAATQKLLGKVKHRRRKTAALLAVLWGYTLLTGAGPSTVRAALFCSFSALEDSFGGQSDRANTLAMTASLLLIWNPGYLHNTGFLLSFGCVGSLLLFQNVTRRRFFLPKGVRTWMEPTVSVLLGTTPLTVTFFNRFCLYQPLANLVLVPCVSALMLLGLLMIAFGTMPIGFVSNLGRLLGNALSVVFEKMVAVLDRMLPLPGATLALKTPPVISLIAYYLFWILILLWRRFPSRLRHAATVAAVIMGALCAVSYAYTPPFSCTFLNVGQGDCAVIRVGGWFSQKTYVIDCGPSYTQATSPFLRANGVTRIDGLFLSHYDKDHVEGVEKLRSEYEVQTLYVAERDEELCPLFENVVVLKQGDVLRDRDFEIRCLSPVAGAHYADDNAASMVLAVDYDRKTVLFCGDATKESEALFARTVGHVDVLKVGHHGSSTSTSDLLLDATSPSYAVISCDREGSYHHPHKETIDALQAHHIPTMVTDDCGAVSYVKGLLGWRMRCIIN